MSRINTVACGIYIHCRYWICFASVGTAYQPGCGSYGDVRGKLEENS